MENYILTREMDQLGRIVIPIDMRRHFGFKAGEPIKIIPTENGILLMSSK